MAPYGWAGSVAASTTAGHGAATPIESSALCAGLAQPIDGAGQRELGGPEPADEVATPHLAALLQHLQHPVDRGVATDDALGQHGLAGDHPVAFDELTGHRMRRLGGRRSRLQQRLDQGPAACPGGRPEHGSAGRAGAGLARPRERRGRHLVR